MMIYNSDAYITTKSLDDKTDERQKMMESKAYECNENLKNGNIVLLVKHGGNNVDV